MRKVFLLAVMVVLFSGLSAASDQNFKFSLPDSDSIGMYEETAFVVECIAGKDHPCPVDTVSEPDTEPVVEICGTEVKMDESGYIGPPAGSFSFKSTRNRDKNVLDGAFKPINLGCSPGKVTAKFRFKSPNQPVDDPAITKDLTIEQKSSGQYMNVKLNFYKYKNPGHLKLPTERDTPVVEQFHFTDDAGHESFGDNPATPQDEKVPQDTAYLLINEDGGGADSQTTDAWQYYEAKEGGIIEVSGDSNLKDITADGELENRGGERTDKVVTRDFTKDVTDNCDTDTFSNGAKCQINLRADQTEDPYMPRGEVIAAYSAKQEIRSMTPERETLRFFICEPSNGNMATSSDRVYANGQQYMCDEGDWRKTPECNDNWDNDWDGFVDHPKDLGCETESDPAEYPDKTDPCSPKILERDVDGDGSTEKAAYYDSGQGSANPKGNNCDYRVDTSIERGQPQQFECQESGENSGNSQTQQRFCSGVQSSWDIYGHGSSVKAVQYHVPKTAIPTSSQDSQKASEYVMDSGKAVNAELPFEASCAENVDSSGNSQGGFINTRCQTLHMAETSYSYGSDPHAESTWNYPRGGQLVDLGDGYSQGEYVDSWGIANTTAETKQNEVSSPIDLITNNDVFPGGFYGKCAGATKWQRQQNEWTCSGAPQWTQAVLMPTIDGATSQQKIGLFIMPYNWKDTGVGTVGSLNLLSYKQAWGRFQGAVSVPSDQNLQSVSVTCYPSESFQLNFDGPEDITPNNPGAEQGTDYFTKENVAIDRSRDKPLAVFGEVALNGNSTYTCRWMYDREGSGSFPLQDDPLADVGSVTNIANANSEVQTFFSEEHTKLTDSGRFSTAALDSAIQAYAP